MRMRRAGAEPPERETRQGLLAERFAFGSELIAEAAALALEYFERRASLLVRSKGTQDMVSEADVEVERLIRTRLAERFPVDAFLGEESGRAEAEGAAGIWVVDPIDGTQPFMSDLTSWCVSIGYVHEGRIELGFVAAPARGEVFAGRRDHGATLNGRPIHVSASTRLDEGLLCIGMSPRVKADQIIAYLEPLLRRGVVYYREGSGALSLAYVAAGRLIGYVESHLNSWDGMGGAALVLAAGGCINDFLANDALWKGGPIVASSEALYPELAAIMGV
jgi:myo-inositol-1(or 4)-monophosphatase